MAWIVRSFGLGSLLVVCVAVAMLIASPTAHAQTGFDGGIPGVCDGCGDDEGPYYPWILSAIDHWGYGYDSLLADLEKWRRNPYIRVDSVGASVQGRAIWELTITDPTSGSAPKRTIFIHARTHPGEVQAFYVTDAMIDYLTSDLPYARLLRERTTFHIMPMYNPDGVELELGRQNAHEIDLERNWSSVPPEPEVATLRRRFLTLMDSPEPIEIALNMHSAGDCKRYFVYHDTIGVSPAFTKLEQRFISGVRSFFPTGIENYTFDVRWQTGLLANFPEGWWWLRYQERVMALTYEDMNCPDAGEYDSTGRAILHGIGLYLGLSNAAAPDVAALPERGELLGAYPNPFKTQTTMRYLLPRREHVRITVRNILGETIETVADRDMQPGEHETVWRPSGAADGIYICTLEIGDVVRSVMLRKF